jgi:hypothetical protein
MNEPSTRESQRIPNQISKEMNAVPHASCGFFRPPASRVKSCPIVETTLLHDRWRIA